MDIKFGQVSLDMIQAVNLKSLLNICKMAGDFCDLLKQRFVGDGWLAACIVMPADKVDVLAAGFEKGLDPFGIGPGQGGSADFRIRVRGPQPQRCD